MRVINTKDLNPSALGYDESLYVYNGLDTCITYEVLETLLLQLNSTTQKTYEFSRALQGPILEMNMRGVLIDEERRHSTISSYREDSLRIANQLNRLLREGIGFDFEISRTQKNPWPSDTKLKDLFYRVLKLPVQKRRNANSEWTETINRAALEKLEGYFYAEPIVKHLLVLRDLGKKISFLSTAVDPDRRLRTSFNIAGTTTGRLASSYSDFGTGCVRPTAEALTPTGWKSLAEIKEGDIIAQWHEDGEISFAECKIFRTNFEGELLRIKTEQVDLAVTPDHRIVYSTYYNSVFKSVPAKTLVKVHQIKIPLGGTNHSGTLVYPAYLAMLMADFSKEGSGWRGSLKKERKIERFYRLAKEFGISFTEQKTRKGYKRFYVPGHLNWPKNWGAWVLSLTPESAEALLEEARYWDSHSRGKAFIFYTADKYQAEWFSILAHTAGKAATIRRMEQSEGSYSNTTMWCVNVKNRDYTQVLKNHWSSMPYTGEVCCPQVPTSYWLVRENGHISVTGNTNLQNVENRLRSVLISDPGRKFCNIDLEQADSRGVGAIHWNLFRDPSYLDACESGDLHTTVCRAAFTELPWTGDLVLDRRVADGKFYRGHSYRDAGKILGHLTNYQGQPDKAHAATKIPYHQVVGFQQNYLKQFPAFKLWWQWVQGQLRDKHQLTTLMKRQRHFFGHWKDGETLRSAIAYEPQSITADTIDRGLLRLWLANRVQLLLQVHDSILFQYKEEEEDEIVPWALQTIREELVLKGGRPFWIPGDAKVGWNWSDDSNDPDSMMKWKGSDSRKRVRQPGKTLLQVLSL